MRKRTHTHTPIYTQNMRCYKRTVLERFTTSQAFVESVLSCIAHREREKESE